MKNRGFAIVAITLVAVIAATSHGYASGLRPHQEGWERFFSVTWDVGDRHGRQVVAGYVSNTSPYAVGGVRVLVDGLDAAGRILDQRIASVPGTLGGHDRLHFEVPVDGASRYDVRVFSYDRIESAQRAVEAP